GGHGGGGGEAAAPPEVPGRPAATDRSGGDAEAGHRAPQPDGPGPLARAGEDVGDDRQGGREDDRRPQSGEAAHGDELAGRGAPGADEAAGPEDGEAGEQRAFAPDAVADTAGGEHEGGEDEGVGVDDPLQLSGRGVELADQGGKRHVHDRGVEVDREHRQTQRQEHGGAPLQGQETGHLRSLRGLEQPGPEYTILKIVVVNPYRCGMLSVWHRTHGHTGTSAIWRWRWSESATDGPCS